MATFPLKNIAVGGNTYEIQSGSESYRVTLSAVFNNTSVPISSMTVKDILETYASSINWRVTGIYKLGHGGGSYDPSQTMINDLVGMKYYQAEYEFRGSDTTKRGNFISWSPEDEEASLPMFGIGEYSPSSISGLVSVTVNTEQNTVSNMRLSDFGGGGGGSSSIEEIVINQIGTGDANYTNLWNIGSSNTTLHVLNGPSDYKTNWTNSSKTYVLKLQQDGTLIYLNQRLKNGSSIYTGYATIYNYDSNDPHSREVQFICNGSPTLQYFTVKRCTPQ